MCTRVSACMYVYMHACVNVHVSMDACMDAYMHAHACTCMLVYACMHACGQVASFQKVVAGCHGHIGYMLGLYCFSENSSFGAATSILIIRLHTQYLSIL